MDAAGHKREGGSEIITDGAVPTDNLPGTPHRARRWQCKNQGEELIKPVT